MEEPIESLTCRFCPELRGRFSQSEFHRYAGLNFGPRIIHETASFVVFPALGQIVPGHVLVVSKKHYASCGFLSLDSCMELDSLLEEVIHNLKRAYGSTSIMFEHGAISSCDKAGCCVDHAHVHAVPLVADIAPRLRSLYVESDVKSMADLRKFVARGLPYLFFASGGGNRTGYEAPMVASQLIRHLVCEQVRLPERADWTANIDIGAVVATMERLAEWSHT